MPFGIEFLFDFNGLLIFKNGANGNLWKSDGTTSGTVEITNISTNYFAVMNNHLYFVGNDGDHGHELWNSDGTTLASGGNDNLLCLWDIRNSGDNSNRTQNYHTPRHSVTVMLLPLLYHLLLLIRTCLLYTSPSPRD